MLIFLLKFFIINFRKDLYKTDKNNIPNHNLLVGGFPCQDYSVARTGAKGMKGKKVYFGGK